jgi:hypothetical protein
MTYSSGLLVTQTVSAASSTDRPGRKGLVVHVAVERPEGGLRYIDVRESEDDWNRFAEERLHPVVHPMFREVFDTLPPEPERTPLPLVHVWRP